MYINKYIKYKIKYLNLNNQHGGKKIFIMIPILYENNIKQYGGMKEDEIKLLESNIIELNEQLSLITLNNYNKWLKSQDLNYELELVVETSEYKLVPISAGVLDSNLHISYNKFNDYFEFLKLRSYELLKHITRYSTGYNFFADKSDSSIKQNFDNLLQNIFIQNNVNFDNPTNIKFGTTKIVFPINYN